MPGQNFTSSSFCFLTLLTFHTARDCIRPHYEYQNWMLSRKHHIPCRMLNSPWTAYYKMWRPAETWLKIIIYLWGVALAILSKFWMAWTIIGRSTFKYMNGLLPVPFSCMWGPISPAPLEWPPGDTLQRCHLEGSDVGRLAQAPGKVTRFTRSIPHDRMHHCSHHLWWPGATGERSSTTQTSWVQTVQDSYAVPQYSEDLLSSSPPPWNQFWTYQVAPGFDPTSMSV